MTIIRFVALALVLSAAPLGAHDMWIEPSSFIPVAGQVVGLRLRVGQDFLGDPIPRDPELIDQFVSVDSSGRKPVYGRDGADPAGLMRITDPGLVVLGYQSHPKPIVLPATTFNQYLKEEGLDAIAELRQRRNQTTNEAREIFARYGYAPLPPSELDNQQLAGRLWELLYAAAARRFFWWSMPSILCRPSARCGRSSKRPVYRFGTSSRLAVAIT